MVLARVGLSPDTGIIEGTLVQRNSFVTNPVQIQKSSTVSKTAGSEKKESPLVCRFLPLLRPHKKGVVTP